MSKILLLRPINLLLLVLVQVVVAFGHWYPSLLASNISPKLNTIEICLLIICTAIITGSANVINDYYDQLTDRVNKPNKQIVGKSINQENVRRYYIQLVTIGLVIAIYLASSIGHLIYISIYIAAVFFLWMYSKTLKKIPIIGNFVVAVYSGLFFFVFVLAEWPINLDNNSVNNSLNILIGFSIFSFLISVSRELIKDIEDVKGDQLAGLKTLPIIAGKKISRLVSISFLLVLLGSTIYWIIEHSIVIRVYGLLLVCLPVLYIIYKVAVARTKHDYQESSSCHKLIMASGFVLLILHIWY